MLVRGGRLVDPTLGLDARRDVRMTDVVTEIAEHLQPNPGEEIVDAAGAVVAPGFIDMHVHLREPGETHKETLQSGGAAALRGGFTAVACMPNTRPALDRVPSLRDLARRIEALRGTLPRIHPIAAITRERFGKEPCDYAALAREGAVGFSDDGDSVVDLAVLRRAAETAREARPPFISHCENPALKGVSAVLSEASFVARDLRVAKETNKAWHIAHVSTRMGVEILRYARANGSAVTAEVTPHHLACTRASASTLGPASRVNPPLGEEEDVRALCDAVREGVIDVFASDHAPHTEKEKFGANPPPGFTGLEIAVGAYAAAIPDLPIAQFVLMLSTAPARILGIPGGTLGVGNPADVTIIRDVSWRVDSRTFASKGRVTPFDGKVLPRRAVATIVGGKILYDATAAPAA